MARRRPRTRVGYGRQHTFQLLTGHDFFGDAFGDNIDAMRQAWPVLRDAACELCATRRGRRLRPWGWWEFEANERRNPAETEAQQLGRLGLLSEHERAALAHRLPPEADSPDPVAVVRADDG